MTEKKNRKTSMSKVAERDLNIKSGDEREPLIYFTIHNHVLVPNRIF